jgi:uncharacterized membrane protein
VLRIYIHDEVPVTSFVIEGKLVGPWVKELEKCWESVWAADPSRSMLVDLESVTFIDSEGRALLTRMRRQGARLQSNGVLIDAIVAEIFAAVPYGIAGGLIALWIMGTPFGFMAFLGTISLVGLIVSHIIVLFDFIEEKHAEGEPLEQAVLDAGIMRLRPVMITVLALVTALVPLAMHGGPLWEPMCYAQMGGMLVATFVTLLLVPVIYSIFVLDLKLIKWEEAGPANEVAPEPPAPGPPAPEAPAPATGD